MNESSKRSKSHMEIKADRFLLLFDGRVLAVFDQDHQGKIGYFADASFQYFCANDRFLRISPDGNLQDIDRPDAYFGLFQFAPELIDRRHFLPFFESNSRPVYILDFTSSTAVLSALDYNQIAAGLLATEAKFPNAPFTKALITVLIGGYIQSTSGRIPASLSFDAVVLSETSSTFIIALTPDFLTSKNLEIDGIEVVQKDNTNVTVEYVDGSRRRN